MVFGHRARGQSRPGAAIPGGRLRGVRPLGAFRVNDGAFYEKYYGFTHQHPDLLCKSRVWAGGWSADKLKEADLIAVPGCYPAAAQLSLKPLIDADLLDLNQWPVINATSSVSMVPDARLLFLTASVKSACSRMACLITAIIRKSLPIWGQCHLYTAQAASRVGSSKPLPAA